MNWDDKGFLLSKNQYNENSLIAEIFTQDHGKISGIISVVLQKNQKLSPNWKPFVYKF